MILSELVRRGRGDRILIVTPKHVLEQMQQELWTRFALPFVRLDSAGIQRILQVLPGNRNPFTYFKRVIHSQCYDLVHYDIPWSLIRIEQRNGRNGRLDRYGHKYRPQITTLLLTPSTARFSGDLRVLARLVDREHEAHTALGDSASLTGTHDVKAEEESIRQVVAGQKELDDVVKTVDEFGVLIRDALGTSVEAMMASKHGLSTFWSADSAARA